MTDIRAAREALIARLTQGSGEAAAPLRRAAFDGQASPPALDALLHKVAEQAHAVTEADIIAARDAGSSEDQLFELIVCAAVGAAARAHDAALAALAVACQEG